MTLLTAYLALLLALIHLSSGRFRSLIHGPRAAWKSAAGGVAVTYVFLHILPDLALHQDMISDETGLAPDRAETFVFMVALAGLTVFYGLERLAATIRDKDPDHPDKAPVFWIHVGAFSLYNALIGYLLVNHEEPDTRSLLLYFIAMATHFLAFDFNLGGGHPQRYHRVARWIIAASLLTGWAIAAFTSMPHLLVSVLFAFLAGGIVLNVLKEEMPNEKQSRFVPFLTGVAGYSLISLVL